MKIEPTRTSCLIPCQDGIARRLVATVRQGLLDHLGVLNEQQLRRLLDSLIDHISRGRTGLAICDDAPRGRPAESGPAGATSSIVSLPQVGGPRHRYAWRQAA